MITTTLYLENFNNAGYYEVEKRVENANLISNYANPKTLVKVQGLLHNFQTTSVKKYQS